MRQFSNKGAPVAEQTRHRVSTSNDGGANPSGRVVPADLESHHWTEVFKYARDGHVGAVVSEPNTSVVGFERQDVAEVLAMVDGENDGPCQVGLFRLHDGRFAAVRASCDYTGWGCQEGGATIVGETLEAVVRFGLGDEERRRLSEVARGTHNGPNEKHLLVLMAMNDLGALR